MNDFYKLQLKKYSLNWRVKKDGNYYTLFGNDYKSLTYPAVYKIFTYDVILKVGQSRNIGYRITDHQQNKDFQNYNKRNILLFISWAKAPESYLDGVEAYLGKYYQPLIGERFPDVAPIPVNLLLP